MNTLPTAPAERSWTWHRWAFFIGMAFAAHVGFIFAFGDRHPVVPRVAVKAPALQFTTYRSEREQLDDPTLFALPHPNGFAGAAWMRRPPIEFHPFRWTEPPRLLALSGAQLGTTFRQFRRTNHFARLELEALSSPELTRIKTGDLTYGPARHSKASLGGDLARREWLTAPIDLPPQFAADLLTNSVVQVWVEADGQVFSTALLPPGSGSKEADQLALKIARAARFAPLPRGDAKLIHGTLIFEWRSVAPTNATPALP